MCWMVWIGTARALPIEPALDPERDWSCVEPIAADAPVRARFATPQVAYVGSHLGCGCGFFSAELAFQGVGSVAEARSLAAAMANDERAAFENEQRSRERLRARIERAREDGPVELFVCWAGGEGAPAIASRPLDPAWITEHLEPFEEQVHYAIVPAETW